MITSSKISKIFSDSYSAAGKKAEAKKSLEKHYEYLRKMINLEEENKIHSIMLGHLSNKNDKDGLFTRYLNEKLVKSDVHVKA